jgi:uncharacterized protein (TIGR02145 family)
MDDMSSSALSKKVKISYGKVKDVEGNEYKTVKIGKQKWMAENLKTTLYNDGTSIPNVTEDASWFSLTTPAFCWYLNEQENKATYGALYNWYALDPASNGGKNVCPTGWHVSSDAEWTTLIDLLGGESVAGGKLKETGLTHWQEPNTGATNEVGFTALPGGLRSPDRQFNDIRHLGFWWTATEYDLSLSWLVEIGSDYIEVSRNHFDKVNGFSVRCVKD